MTKERIQQIANFFYSSDDISDVPLRLSISMGQFRGADLEKDDCIELLKILSESDELKKDLASFVQNREL